MKNLHTIDPKEKALDRLLADAKAEWDEAWMSEAESHIPRGMEQRLAATLARLEGTSATKTARIEPRSRRITWAKVAAAVALVIGLGVGVRMALANEENPFTDTCQSPAEAQQHLRAALMLMGEKGSLARQRADESLRQMAVIDPAWFNGMNK